MKIIGYLIPVVTIVVLLLFLLSIELDVKYSFGPEQSDYVFQKGQALSETSFSFIAALIFLSAASIVIQVIQSRQRK